MRLELPVRFGRYELESVLGEGGMAAVYRAVLHGPAGFQKRVAVKIAHRGERKPWTIPSLYAEGRIAGGLRHRHVVDVYEVGVVEEQPYIAMELVEGLTLARLITSTPRRPPSVDCAIALATPRPLRGPRAARGGSTLGARPSGPQAVQRPAGLGREREDRRLRDRDLAGHRRRRSRRQPLLGNSGLHVPRAGSVGGGGRSLRPFFPGHPAG